MELVIVVLSIMGALSVLVGLFAIMGRVSDPEPRDPRREGPGIPTEEEEADAEYRRRGWL